MKDVFTLFAVFVLVFMFFDGVFDVCANLPIFAGLGVCAIISAVMMHIFEGITKK